MRANAELTMFRSVVGLILLIPLVVGAVGALGGLEGLAGLFAVDPSIVVPASLRSSLRAICWMFVAIAPQVVWALRSMKERAGAFRIILGFGSVAGLVRLLGWFVDGYPGAVPLVIMFLELVVLPVTLVWHARLVRREGAAA